MWDGGKENRAMERMQSKAGKAEAGREAVAMVARWKLPGNGMTMVGVLMNRSVGERGR